MRVALVSARVSEGHDDDAPLLIAALTARGAHVEVVDWDDPGAAWGSFDLAVIRSTWDYTQRLDDFLEWTEVAGAMTRLHNDPCVITWNCDKRYLLDLIAAGIAVVPTEYLDPGDLVVLPAAGEFVVKPTVSAGSRDTARYGTSSDRQPQREAIAHVDRLLNEGRTVMVQPYQRSVDEKGETALIYFGGEFSHAVGKAALLQPDAQPTSALFAPESITTREASDDERALGAAVILSLASIPALAEVEWPPLYARIDVVEADDATMRVLEVELIEPSLFLPTAAGAAERFADSIVAAAR